jgi:protein-disulfide isomerase-like protein with CxxC motif
VAPPAPQLHPSRVTLDAVAAAVAAAVALALDAASAAVALTLDAVAAAVALDAASDVLELALAKHLRRRFFPGFVVSNRDRIRLLESNAGYMVSNPDHFRTVFLVFPGLVTGRQPGLQNR